MHQMQFPILSWIVCDILCIPGVSISVKCLFSSSKRTISDAQCHLMTATTASKTLITE
ncbi:hypothetical protein K439DRAFT_1324521 [Ramaria rubella]|nr:hypothetical protein K439DRAFT_1324521 [Ramaria rubella]